MDILMNEDFGHKDFDVSIYDIAAPTCEDPTLVVCPQCENLAKVIPMEDKEVKAVCTSCGFSKKSSAHKVCFNWYEETPTDGYFGYKLWLEISCCGKNLWAFNIRHLDFLETFISSKHRNVSDALDRDIIRNKTLSSRLPKWIKSQKNRNELLSGISKLRKTI